MTFVKEPKPADPEITTLEAFKQGWRQVWITLKHIRKLKYVVLFLLGYWLYIDGVDTIIRMAIDYGESIFEEQGLDVTIYLMAALLVTQFVAFPGTLLFNKYAEKVGIKNGVLTAIGAYCVITLLGYFMGEVWHFFALAVMIGLFQGGIQALSRSLYSRLIPEKQAGEFYGFFNMLGKFAGSCPQDLTTEELMNEPDFGDMTRDEYNNRPSYDPEPRLTTARRIAKRLQARVIDVNLPDDAEPGEIY